jgi:hypothetical protein
MEAACSSEPSVYFERTTQHYILEDRTLYVDLYLFYVQTVEIC